LLVEFTPFKFEIGESVRYGCEREISILINIL
jgi:hypothetical protein